MVVYIITATLPSLPNQPQFHQSSLYISSLNQAITALEPV